MPPYIYNDDVEMYDPSYETADNTTTTVTDNSTQGTSPIVPPIPVSDTNTRPVDGWLKDMTSSGGTAAEVYIDSPPAEQVPLSSRTKTIKEKTRFVIQDYRQTYLRNLYNQGFKFYVIYSDGTENEVDYTEVTNPETVATETYVNEAYSIATAINQHFWDDTNGIHVTDVTKDDWLSAAANSFSGLASYRQYHNILINSLGLLLRSALVNLVSLSRSGTAIYDGTGNASSNILAMFGATTTIGRTGKARVKINFQGFEVYNKSDSSIATVRTLNNENGEYFCTLLCHIDGRTDSSGSITQVDVLFSKTGISPLKIYRFKTDESSPTIIVEQTISHEDSYTIRNGALYDSGFNSTSEPWFSALLPYVGQDVRVDISTMQLYNEYSFGIRNYGYAAGASAMLIGDGNKSIGMASLSHGKDVVAKNYASHAEGRQTNAEGIGSHTEGYQTLAQGPNYSSDAYNHAEGISTKVYSYGGHAEGSTTKVESVASYGHAEGQGTIVGQLVDLVPEVLAQQLEAYAPIATYPNRSYIDNSTSDYIRLKLFRNSSDTGMSYSRKPRYAAGGTGAHAEGWNTRAYGEYSHSEGRDTITSRNALASHTGGMGTYSVTPYCTVVGTYNDYSLDESVARFHTGSVGNYHARLFVVGNGSSGTRSNALAVNSDGSTEVKSLIVGTWPSAYTLINYYNGELRFNTGLNTLGNGIRDVTCLEMYPNSSSANNGGYLDFHYNRSTADYTTRIIETASGVLTISGSWGIRVTGSYNTVKKTDADSSLASRSSNQFLSTFGTLDKNDRWCSYMDTNLLTDGSSSVQITARCYNGGNKQNTIQVIAKRDGTATYALTSPANFRSAIGAAASSDRRLKSNLMPLGDEAVDFINSLTAYQYDIGPEDQKRHEVGVIAQDVNEADPWDTNMAFETQEGIDGLDDWEKMEDGSPTWKMDYIRLIPPLITTVQKLTKRVEDLENEIAELKQRIND